jgi:hypothetical protein
VFLLEFAIRLAELMSLVIRVVLDLLHVWPVYLDLTLAFVPAPDPVTDLSTKELHTETIAQHGYRERTRTRVLTSTLVLVPPPRENRTSMATKVADAMQPTTNHTRLVAMIAHAARETSAVSVPSTPDVT